jgi:transglutaminase-like putative cysteine protease
VRAFRGSVTAALVLSVMSSAFGAALSKRAWFGSTESKTRDFEFSYKAQIPVLPGTKRMRIWLPYPKSDANQEIYDIQISSPGVASVYSEPKYGNDVLSCTIQDPQDPSVGVEIRFKVRRSEYRRDLGAFKRVLSGSLDPEISAYLKPDRLVPLTDQIRRLSAEVTRGKKTELEMARAIYDYTLANMKYDKSGEGWGRGDILYACDAKHGNCTDFHALFIGLCRSAGLPARFSIGFPLPDKRGEGEIQGYHCWAEFYLKGYGWVPVDASEASKHPEKKDYFFGSHDENRIQFSTGRDLILRPVQQGSALNYFIYPYAEADGKAVDGIKKEFRFRDIDGAAAFAGFLSISDPVR